jgi:hypothetical protein
MLKLDLSYPILFYLYHILYKYLHYYCHYALSNRNEKEYQVNHVG